MAPQDVQHGVLQRRPRQRGVGAQEILNLLHLLFFVQGLVLEDLQAFLEEVFRNHVVMGWDSGHAERRNKLSWRRKGFRVLPNMPATRTQTDLRYPRNYSSY
jgi:hypothetical protein